MASTKVAFLGLLGALVAVAWFIPLLQLVLMVVAGLVSAIFGATVRALLCQPFCPGLSSMFTFIAHACGARTEKRMGSAPEDAQAARVGVPLGQGGAMAT